MVKHYYKWFELDFHLLIIYRILLIGIDCIYKNAHMKKILIVISLSLGVIIHGLASEHYVQWESLQNITAMNNGDLVKFAGSSWTNNHALSQDVLGDGENGYVSFKINLFDNFRVKFVSVDGTNILDEYTIEIAPFKLKVFVNGTYYGSYNNKWQNGAKYYLERSGSQILFKKWNNTFLSLNTDPSKELQIYCQIAHNLNVIKQVETNFISNIHDADIAICNTPNLAPDANNNWSESKSFNQNGDVININRTYYDEFGRINQSQSANFNEQRVFVNTEVYDEFGRVAKSFLPAPEVSGSDVYDIKYREQSTIIDNVNEYYGNNQSVEEYVAKTSYPYTMSNYHDNLSGLAISSFSAGEKYSPDATSSDGLSNNSIIMPANNELEHYFELRQQLLPNDPFENKLQVTKKVVQDADGKSSIQFIDGSGNVLANAMYNQSYDNPITVNGIVEEDKTIHYLHMSNIDIVVGNGENGFSVNSDFEFDDDAFVLVIQSSSSTDLNGSSSIYYAGKAKYMPFVEQSTGTLGTVEEYLFVATSMFKIREMKANVLKDNSTSDYGLKVYQDLLNDSYGGFTNPLASFIKENSVKTSYVFQNTKIDNVISFNNPHVFDLVGEVEFLSVGNFDRSNCSFENSFVIGSNGYNLTLPCEGYYKVTFDGEHLFPITVDFELNHYDDWTYNFFNNLGQLIHTIAPKGVMELVNNNWNSNPTQINFLSTNRYNSDGLLTKSEAPDINGVSYFLYSEDGKIRFSQNPVQRITGKFSYSHYDENSRIIELGEYNPSQGNNCPGTNTYGFVPYDETNWSITPANASDIRYIVNNNSIGFCAQQCSDQSFYSYDKVDKIHPITEDLYYYPTDLNNNFGYKQTFLKGRLSRLYNINETEWYSYDYRGRLKWLITYQSAQIGYVIMNYTYDDFSNLLLSTEYLRYKDGSFVDAEALTTMYEYDCNYRLESVYTKTPVLGKRHEATYEYYVHGPLKRLEIANELQGIDYYYSVNGWLKGINHPSLDKNKDPGKDGTLGEGHDNFKPDVFGMWLHYYSGDYVSNGFNEDNDVLGIQSTVNNFYSGNITAQTWKTANLNHNLTNSEANTYHYNYDHRNWLLQAQFGKTTLSNVNTVDVDFRYAASYQYDYNGNSKFLDRNGYIETGLNKADLDKLRYYYLPNSNKLNYIDDLAASPGYDGEFEDQTFGNYSYDNLGRLTGNIQENLHNIIYDVYGKVVGVVKDNGEQISYFYNAKGERIKKVIGNGIAPKIINYVRDEQGNIISVYEFDATSNNPTFKQKEASIFAANRIGSITFDENGNRNSYYELTDHLGNVRAILNREYDPSSSNNNQLVSYADYYPFGWLMPGTEHRSGQQDYRYGYQGQFSEKDNETGWNQFEARMWDTRIGRWLSTDPAGQFSSPYLGMGNNPINGIDPDGAFFKTDFVNRQTGEHIYVQDGMEQIVFVDNENWSFIQNMNIASIWTMEDADRYFNIIEAGLLDLNSDMGLLIRLAYAEMDGKELNSMRIVAESAYNRANYNGKYADKYNPQLQPSNIYDVIHADKGYAQTPNKQQFTDPYAYLNGGGGFGSEYRDKFARASLARAAYAGYLTINQPSSHIGSGVIFYHSYHQDNSVKAWNYLTKNMAPTAFKQGDLINLNLSLPGFGAGAALKQ